MPCDHKNIGTFIQLGVNITKCYDCGEVLKADPAPVPPPFSQQTKPSMTPEFATGFSHDLNLAINKLKEEITRKIGEASGHGRNLTCGNLAITTRGELYILVMPLIEGPTSRLDDFMQLQQQGPKVVGDAAKVVD